MMKFILCLLFWLVLQSVAGVKFWLILYFILLFYGVYLFMGVPLFLGFSMGASEIGWDIMSFSLIVLSVWLMVVVFCSSFSINKDHSLDWYYGILVFSLMLMLIFSFSSLNFLGFYLFFEGSLIPTFLIIMGWGYQPERLQASIYFLFYTVTSSLPLLLGLVSLYINSGFLLNYSSWDVSVVPSNLVSWGFGFVMISAFLVKMPMFMVHLWLPKAHVEAPVAGSMVLAGVLLKLGGYGLMRVFDKFPKFVWLSSSWFVSLGLLGMAYVGLMCCRLNDMKALVAYSSVAHMGLVIIGCFIMSVWGFDGALMMMLGHGLASSGLFMSLNLFYDRSSSRSFFINKGLMVLFPIFSLFFFLLCASNIAAPPTLNLLSEMYLMGGILGYDKLMLLIFPLGSFLGAVFSVYLFSNSQHGNLGFSKSGFWGVYWIELHGLSLHVIPLNIMVLKFELLTVWV